MPQSEHFDILKRGVEAWNQWRDAHPEIEPDLIDEEGRRHWVVYYPVDN